MADSIPECRTKTVPEQVAQPLHLGHADPGLSDLTGFAERRGQQSAFRSGAPPTLVASAVDQGLERNAAPDIKRADPFRRVELVARDREQIGTEFVHLCRYLADGLRRVCMQRNPMLARDVGNGFGGADLVVRVHDADETRILCDRFANGVGIDEASSSGT